MADEPRSGGDKRLPGNDGPRMGTSFAIDPDLVAQRAYARYQQRGGEHGRDQQDWFEAERELIAAQHEQE
jgi:hypothetical protein